MRIYLTNIINYEANKKCNYVNYVYIRLTLTILQQRAWTA